MIRINFNKQGTLANQISKNVKFYGTSCSKINVLVT